MRALDVRVCTTTATTSATCASLSINGGRFMCEHVEARVECADKLVRNQADVAYFSQEETLLLAQQQPTENRVIATVRDVSNMGPYDFEAVAVVPINHTNGLEGLRGGVYCHPGFDEKDAKWSPRVLKTLEQLAARTDRCQDVNTAGKTAEEIEVDTLKSRYSSLCSRCGPDASCSRYTLDMGVGVAGVRNDNSHIQALECLRVNSNATNTAVAANAEAVYLALRSAWPAGSSPSGSWQATLFTMLAGGANARVFVPSAALKPVPPACLPAAGAPSPLRRTPSATGCDLQLIHYQLTPVKLIQNQPINATRIAAFVKESSVVSGNVSRFENLRDRNACFPEFGGLAYVSFVRTGHERGILSTSESVCSWDYASNRYFGNNGTIACLADPANDLEETQFRALCRNNSLALRTGIEIDDGCLLSLVFDSEIVVRSKVPATVTKVKNKIEDSKKVYA
ncbi:hypothetical protein SFRURICE_002872 [Spodoptera frugiperda]|nr:hypothetical protein SFRURICE_002872 [Spodoptera frugiperda]